MAVLEGARCLAESPLPADVSSIQALAPTIARLLREAGSSKIECVSITNGPGSFTSLRVGLATAQMLGFAWQIPVVPICSLRAIAFRASEQLRVEPARGGVWVVAVLNAFRKQVFAASWWCCKSAGMQPIAVPQVVDADVWISHPLESLQRSSGDDDGDGEVLITGPGLEIYRPETAGVRLAPADLWWPRAADVGQLGWQALQRGEFLEPAELRANYVRTSAAEEKMREGQG